MARSISAKRSVAQKEAAKKRQQTWRKGQSGNPNGNPSTGKTTRDYLLWCRFRITKEDYNALLDEQGGVCAICGKPETKTRSRGNGENRTLDNLCVDHNHITGKIRGLLCYRCNTGLGKLGDDMTILRQAIEYLKNGI